jgi:transposase
MGIGRPTKSLNLTAEERDKLAMLARRPKSAQAMAMRARIVLGCDEGLSNRAVAKKLQITGATVCKWRERFRVNRLEGLLDEPRPGAPRSIADEQVEAVVTKTLESMPANSTHWSTRLMAKKAGLSQTAIVRIWHAFGLQPHRVENFKFSKDPQFVEKVRDIVGLYMHPPERAIVLCVDEKSQVQALNRTQPILPMAPGVPARQSHDYERHGVTSLFAAMDVASGVTISNCYRRHRHQEFLRFLNDVGRQSSSRARRPSGNGQLRHPQGEQSARLAHAAPPISRTLHADQRKLVKPGGAAIRRSDGAVRTTRKPHRGRATGESHARLPGQTQSKSQAFRVDGRRRSHPGEGRETLSTNF